MANEIIICDSNYAVETLNRINRSRHENAHCDFIIKVDGVEIPVHKLVICANSDYFNAMLSHQETLESKSGIVEMRETDIESVKICIDFIYTGRAEFSYENAANVLHNAKMFHLKELCEGIVDFLSDNLSAGTFCHSKKLATMYSCETLSKECDEFALVHFEEIANKNDFVNLDKKYVSHLLKSKKLEVSEEMKLQTLVKWIKHDSENRKQHFVDMLKHVKLADVPISYRRYLVENEDLLKVSMECMAKFMVSVFDSFDVVTRKLEEVQATGGHGVSQSQGIGVYRTRSSSLQIFNPSNKTWSDKQWKIPDATGQFCTMLLWNNDIYVLSSNQSVYKLCYTEANATWQQMQSMKYKHGNYPPAVAFNGLIYVAGCGWGSATEKVEKYDPVSNTWTAISDCQEALRGSSLAATSDAIYKIGGYGKVASSSVEKYNPNTGQWCYVAPMNRPRFDSAAVTFNNKIYFLGSRGSQQRSIECYDETNNTWTIVNGMQLPYTLTSACVVNQEVYGCGYDLNTGKYKILKLNFENKSVEVICEYEAEEYYSSTIFAMKWID